MSLRLSYYEKNISIPMPSLNKNFKTFYLPPQPHIFFLVSTCVHSRFCKAKQTISLALINQCIKATGYSARLWEVTLPKKYLIYVML